MIPIVTCTHLVTSFRHALPTHANVRRANILTVKQISYTHAASGRHSSCGRTTQD